VNEVVGANTVAAFAFAREAILAFKQNELSVSAVDETGAANPVLVNGKRGFLAFTGATASVKAGPVSSAFSASKFAIRALTQSLAKEFGKENIHVPPSFLFFFFTIVHHTRLFSI
jgi:NAD(P)-dependent dehydrogenase (short-subunit alcohol dehydrogenase family)